jgi:dolichol-phosphate mannosyltransferase
MGLGSATLAAAEYAIDNGYEIFITMDADWSHDPAHLPAMVAALDEADVAIGSRYCPGGAIEGWPLHRRVVSRAMNGLSRLVLRLPLSDTSGAYRAYRVERLQSIDRSQVQSAGYSYLEEILWYLHAAGARFREVPITFRERRAGQSKINAQEALAKIKMLVRLRGNRH